MRSDVLPSATLFAEFPDRDDWGNQADGAQGTSGLLGNTPPFVYTASLKRNKSPWLGGLTHDLLVHVGGENLDTDEYARRREVLLGVPRAHCGTLSHHEKWRSPARPSQFAQYHGTAPGKVWGL